MTNTTKVGLRERISNAKTRDEVDTLLAEGNGYQVASRGTRNAWKNTARRVLGDKKPVVVEETEAPVAEVTVKKYPKNKKH